jgi:hypothetical protein
MSEAGSNRSAYLLIADGRRASFRERWRAVGAVAYQSQAAAEDALEAWVVGLAAEPGEGLMAVEPATIMGRVVALSLVDGLVDDEATELHLIHAKGHSAVFSEPFESLCRRVFTDRAQAEAEAPLHAARCCDPGLGMNYAVPGTVEVTVQTISLAPLPDEAPGPTGP